MEFHAARQLVDKPKEEHPDDDPDLFGHVAKTKKGSRILCFGEHLRIGRSR